MTVRVETIGRARLRLGHRQWEFLGRVVATNGGGVNCYSADERVYRALERKGLIQGKSGQQCCAVHTREGLEAWRAHQAETVA